MKFILYLLILLICAAGLGGLYFWNQVSLPNSDNEGTVFFTVSQGEGVKIIAVHLLEQGLIRDQFWFETFVYLDRSEAKFIAGSYQLAKNLDIREVANLMTSGSNTPEDSITVIEGWTSQDIANYLEKNGRATAADFLAAAETIDSRALLPEKDYDFLADKPASQDLEGYLFPDTYRIYSDSRPAEIVEKMLDNFGDKYTQQMRADTIKGNLTIYQVVTLASIIQKETNIVLDQNGKPLNNDHYIVAGIFYNRLNAGIPLQSDATVNFVTGKQDTQPSAADLETESPYNTYKYKGLPPGPIGNPSLEAIKAAIYPEKTDYLYFLHKIHSDGSTVFSKTYEEHLENKRKYLQ